MHTYTGVIQTLQAFIMYTNIDYNIHGTIPLLLIPLCWIPFAPLSNPLYLLGNPPSCDRIRPPRSQVACKLTSPFSSLSPVPPPLQIPRTHVIKCLTMTTSRIRLLLSGTLIVQRYGSQCSQGHVINACRSFYSDVVINFGFFCPAH
jgi:hypothetical protein